MSFVRSPTTAHIESSNDTTTSESMRLLYYDGDKLCRTAFLQSPPAYAILSHRYGADEITYEDVTHSTGQHKEGFAKVRFCSAQARQDGIKYFWLDNACINRNDAVELSSSIQSMYRWYANAKRCYVYLQDVRCRWFETSSDEAGVLQWDAQFRSSTWFTRGWTLQELLAPKSLSFYSNEGILLGERSDLVQVIQGITSIETEALEGKVFACSLSQRLKWAMHRDTTRPEDRAYCLLGLLNIKLALHYGEGLVSALRRLQVEIDRTAGEQLGSPVDIDFIWNSESLSRGWRGGGGGRRLPDRRPIDPDRNQ